MSAPHTECLWLPGVVSLESVEQSYTRALRYPAYYHAKYLSYASRGIDMNLTAYTGRPCPDPSEVLGKIRSDQSEDPPVLPYLDESVLGGDWDTPWSGYWGSSGPINYARAFGDEPFGYAYNPEEPDPGTHDSSGESTVYGPVIRVVQLRAAMIRAVIAIKLQLQQERLMTFGQHGGRPLGSKDKVPRRLPPGYHHRT